MFSCKRFDIKNSIAIEIYSPCKYRACIVINLDTSMMTFGHCSVNTM